MKQRISAKLSALLLVLAVLASFCGCGVSPQELLEALHPPQTDLPQDPPPQQLPPKEETALPAGAPTSDTDTTQPNRPVEETPPPNAETPEGMQSLAWLRERMGFPGMTFGAAYLGYVGGLFEEGFEAGFPLWLQETNPAMLEKYPFIAQIDAGHIVGGAGHLYCIVPVDENASVTISRVQWNGDTQTETVTDTIYHSENGAPVLLFANLDDLPMLADTQVIVTDSQGNTCQWYPTLDAQNHIVPNVAADGSYTPFDFTEYGWQVAPSYLAPWLADDWEGITAATLADNGWHTKTTVRDSDRSAYFALWFYPGDETGGTADLYWTYEGSDTIEEFWVGSWSIETVMEGPSYITFDLSLKWDKDGITPADASQIQETYPILGSPSGNLLIGVGETGICLPFMSKSTNICILTWMEK